MNNQLVDEITKPLSQQSKIRPKKAEDVEAMPQIQEIADIMETPLKNDIKTREIMVEK